mmetsp:Transcript_4771/g.12332  ORF Transcript_4771/g.12332 Transcript_4771/m.12332 type:complete len:159 (+) Transcript_4771:121-597(+)
MAAETKLRTMKRQYRLGKKAEATLCAGWDTDMSQTRTAVEVMFDLKATAAKGMQRSCANCDKRGEWTACDRCHEEWYCSKDCHDEHSAEHDAQFCENCGKSGELKTCMRCAQVWYRSVDCQREDWYAEHKAKCVRKETKGKESVPSGKGKKKSSKGKK